NIELGLKYQGVDDKVRRDKVYRIAELLGLTQYLDYYPNMVSGGTRRKTSIARAIVLDPDILLLDEPFTGLDLDTTNTLIKMLSIIPSKLNMTLLIVSHQFQELLQIVDRLYILGGVPSKIADEINIRNLGREERIIKVIKAFNMSKT
ncbi:MAG TPA: ATP-binding cassette domain-containing protein, partial [Thermoprotei archaeon]|nr:ATP-binding cassette domain-containing protein [Thermoprotei archaeon]